RYVQEIGDLTGRVVEQVAENDHGPVLRLEHRQTRRDAVRERAEVARVEVVGRLDLRGLATQGPGPRPVDRSVDDDAMQPRPEGTPAVETVEVSNCGQKRLLRD